MKESFEQLYHLMQKNHRFSPWVQQTSLKDHALELQKEVKEMIDEIDKEDYDNFKQELGDVFWDTLKLMAHAEDKGWFSIKEMLDDVHEKINRRKPFLSEERHVTLEEESKIWHEVKKQEKNERNRS